jgi:Mannose-6-phosphate receptor
MNIISYIFFVGGVFALIPQTSFYFGDIGYEFDLSIIQQNGPYSYYDSQGNKNYAFTVCDDVALSQCPPSLNSSVAFEVISGGGCLTSYGSAINGPVVNARLFDGENPMLGIVLTYEAFSPTCDAFGTLPYTIFNVLCNYSVPISAVSNFDIVEPGCGIEFTLSSIAGCPLYRPRVVNSLGPGWIVFIIVQVLIFFYIVGGCIYKRRIFGASGWEALPNIEFWRQVFHRLTCYRYQQQSSDYYAIAAAEIDDYL